MRILYVIGKSQYDSTAVFMMQMAHRMSEYGWDVTILDGRVECDYIKKRNIVIQSEYDVVFTINGMLLEKESELGKILLSKKNVLYCTYLMDHPMVHYQRLKNSYPYIFILSPDRNHVQFLDRYMKNIYAEAFLPHGGCGIENSISYNNRKYDITFMGSYSNPGNVWNHFEHYPLPMAELMKDTARRMLETPSLIMEDSLRMCLQNRGILCEDEEFAQILSEFWEVDRYVRSFFRDKVIRVLVENGIIVDVFGDGWEDFNTENRECLRVHAAVEYEQSLMVVGDSKISLNVMPWFKDGSHDRIFSAMMCGTLCLTDSSQYLLEQFRDGEDICFYFLEALNDLPKKVKKILQNEKESAMIAENGRKLAFQRHTWSIRAMEVIEYVEQIIKIKNKKEKLFRKTIFTLQDGLIKNIDETIFRLHRQEYLYAMRNLKEIIDRIDELLTIYEKKSELVFDENEILDILHNLFAIQEHGDYVFLADILQFKLLPFLTKMQNEYGVISQDKIEISEGYRIENTSLGNYTLAIEQNNNWIYLHSKGNPYREAAEIASFWFDKECYEYVVYGLGLGYHIQALLDIDETIKVTILESDVNVLRLAKQYGVINEENFRKRVRIILDADFQYLSALSHSLQEKQKFVVYYPSLFMIKNEFYRQQLEEYFISYSSAKTQEIRLIGNFFKNGKFFRHEVTELSDNFKNKIAYIIAAGPSLDKNIQELKRVKDNGIIIATGTVLKKMLHCGIKPNYVIITDGGEFTHNQTKDIGDCDFDLIFLSTVYYKIPEEYPGNKYVIFQKGVFKSELYAQELGLPLYDTGGSVTTTALEICIRFQCRKVVFVGLDLAYTNGVNHASDTSDVRGGLSGNVVVKDIYGKNIVSAKNLCIYRKWIEKRVKKDDAAKIEFIDATEGGALINGMKVQTLKKVIQDGEKGGE